MTQGDWRAPGMEPALVRRCQLIQLRLLKVFKHVCATEHFTFWLDGGTLLGAVRHAGFIPWDDDVDIAMPRRDFELFKRRAGPLLPRDVFLQAFETDGFPVRQMMKLRDTGSTQIERKESQRRATYHQGVFIDIFPVDRIRADRAVYAQRFGNVLNWRVSFEKGRNLSARDKIEKVAIFVRDRIVGYERLSSLYHSLLGAGSSDRYLYFQVFKAKDFPNLLLEEDDIFPLRDVRFGDDSFPGPNDSHKYLTLMYADYMTLPPLSQRVPHSLQILPETPSRHQAARETGE